MAELDARRAEVLGNAARRIQRQSRTFIARKEFRALRGAAIVLQSNVRGIFFPSFLASLCSHDISGLLRSVYFLYSVANVKYS